MKGVLSRETTITDATVISTATEIVRWAVVDVLIVSMLIIEPTIARLAVIHVGNPDWGMNQMGAPGCEIYKV